MRMPNYANSVNRRSKESVVTSYLVSLVAVSLVHVHSWNVAETGFLVALRVFRLFLLLAAALLRYFLALGATHVLSDFVFRKLEFRNQKKISW